MKVKSYFDTIALLLLFTLCVSCVSSKEVSEGESILTHSSLLKIFNRDGYDEVVVNNAKGNLISRYILLEKGREMPDSIPSETHAIYVPLERVIIDSEVYASAFEELGKSEILKGIFDGSYATSPDIQARLSNKEIMDVGTPSAPDIERIVELNPEVMLISYFDGMKAQGLENRGIPIIKMVDLQEETPLGRAEWLKLIGRLVGKEETADSIFNSVANSYEAVIEENSETDGKAPIVLTDLMYEGTWYVPGGKSYQTHLIEDAGGVYFKQNDRHTVTLNLTPEQVLTEGGDADIWIIRHFGNEENLTAILRADPVYGEIKAYKDGNIYYSDTSKSALFREFPFHPDILLRDYRHIMKNEGSDENLRYFKKLSLQQ